MNPNPPILELSGLSVRRNPAFTVSVKKLELAPGTALCLTGVNGSGKTTFLEALVGLTLPSSGHILMNGHPQDGRQTLSKREVGYVPDDDGWIIPELTAHEFFLLLASLHPASLLDEALSLAGKLSFTAFHQQLSSLSHGNRKKVQLIAALMHHPKLLVIDELRNGLDPIAIKVAEDILKEEARNGCAIIAASHDLWWSERFSDEVIILSNGAIVLHGKTADIAAEHGSLETAFMKSQP